MSEENLELVRTLAEGFQRRRHEQAFEFYDPEIEWDASGLADADPDIAGVYHGHEGVRAYWRNWLSAWNDLHFEIEDMLEAGDDVVLLIHSHRMWGRSSGIEAEMPPTGSCSRFAVARSSDGASSRPSIGARSRRAVGVAALDEERLDFVARAAWIRVGATSATRAKRQRRGPDVDGSSHESEDGRRRSRLRSPPCDT